MQDKRQILAQTLEAKKVAEDQFQPADVRQMAKKAADLGDVVLGLRDAKARRQGLPKSGLREPEDPMNSPAPNLDIFNPKAS